MCLWNKLDSVLQAVEGGAKANKGWKKLTSYFIFFTNHFTLTTIRRKYAAVNSVSWSSFVLSRYEPFLNVRFTVHLNVFKQRINWKYSKSSATFAVVRVSVFLEQWTVPFALNRWHLLTQVQENSKNYSQDIGWYLHNAIADRLMTFDMAGNYGQI